MKTQPFAEDDYEYRVPKQHPVRIVVAGLVLLAGALGVAAYYINRPATMPSYVEALIGTSAGSATAKPPAHESAGARDRTPLRAEQPAPSSEAAIAAAPAPAPELGTAPERPTGPRARVMPPAAPHGRAARPVPEGDPDNPYDTPETPAPPAPSATPAPAPKPSTIAQPDPTTPPPKPTSGDGF